jgi:hypothetical protein
MLPIEVRPMTENTCWEGLDRIFGKTVDVWSYLASQLHSWIAGGEQKILKAA